MEKASFKYLVQFSENSWGIMGTKTMIVRNSNHNLELRDAQTMRRYEIGEIERILRVLSTHTADPHESFIIDSLIKAEADVLIDLKAHAVKRLGIQEQSIKALSSGMERQEKENKQLRARLFAYELIAVVVGLLAICAIIRLSTI